MFVIGLSVCVSDHCAAGQREFPFEINSYSVLFHWWRRDDAYGGGGGESRTGGAGNSGLRTHPIRFLEFF